MNTLEPLAVALKYGFLAILYLFLLWVARSALRDIYGSRRARGAGGGAGGAPAADATGMYPAAALHRYDIGRHAPRLVVERAPGHEPGMIYDLDGSELLLGRGPRAQIRLEDPYASASHARIFVQGGILAIEDLGSTNGTYLNEELLETPRPLHPGDRLRIGESEFAFETD
ncbi:MAG TPA: FHA domain-containing protein [Solirubrobacteraceae bacterium]|nr:FHA domain-containing protein [Solirubrobacteraceae bacterium]